MPEVDIDPFHGLARVNVDHLHVEEQINARLGFAYVSPNKHASNVYLGISQETRYRHARDRVHKRALPRSQG